MIPRPSGVARVALATLAWIAWVAFAGTPAGAPPARADSTPALARDTLGTEAARADSASPLALARDTLDADALRLRRAALASRRGDLRGVVEDLEGMSFAGEPSFEEADRAAFLLGQAYLRLGSTDRFEALARSVAAWKRESVFTRWIAYQRLLVRSEPGTPARARGGPSVDTRGEAGGDRGDALRRLIAGGATAGHPATRTLPLEALGRGGADSSVDLAALAAADTGTALGRDLAGAALIQLATRALAAGQDPRPWLERVPVLSRYASRARHMLGLARLERGEAGAGAAVLESLLAKDSSYAARREVRLALAGQALDQARWEPAYQAYDAVERDWTDERADLERRLAGSSFADLWPYWQSHPDLSSMLWLDADSARSLAAGLGLAATDLAARPDLEAPPLDAPTSAPGPAWPIAPPPPDDWQKLAASAHDLDESTAELARARWATLREAEALADRRRYLGLGLGQVREQQVRLREQKARLDSLRKTLDGLDARLRAVRDAERRRVALRTAAILEACATHLLTTRAMRHFWIAGPDSARVASHPDGYPGLDSLREAEERLADAIRSSTERIAAETPERLARSYAEAWRPQLIDRAAAEGVRAGLALVWARRLEGAMDSSLAASWNSDSLQRLERRLTALTSRTDSLRGVHFTLRAQLARAAVERALARLEDEREGIDYGLAASAYGMSVRLDARDSSRASVTAAPESVTAAARAADTTRAGAAGAAGPEPGEAPEDSVTAQWRARAIPRLEAFLERHPRSFARAEMRFRLADLELTDDRQRFRERMAEFVRRQAAGEAAGLRVPILSHARTLALYRLILQEDRDFNHRDAVLFNAGMILADAADPEAAGFFHTLVTDHPQSPYCQEAYLRMGDVEFNDRRFEESVACYSRAATGSDPTLSTIAEYKRGWAHFNQDRFADAADAFRAVLDLYTSNPRGAIHVDIEGEAEAYLVHSLAGAGGAPAFAAYFDRVGARPYERRVLMALGQHYRRYGEFPNAAAADQLWIQRYPRDPDALVIAGRMVETYQRSNRPALEQEARLTLAPEFAPGSDWSLAQASDSVRAAGSDFARASWLSVARDHHRRAREQGSGADWREAARLYELVLAHWPHEPEAPRLELQAGEASAHLGDYRAALRHYGAAARSDQDSVAALALWQRVAVTDAWYEATRPAAAGRGAGTARDSLAPAPATGRDSLARAVIESGDQLLARFPAHPRGADIVWRQSQLAVAHGWQERALADLERMTTRYPGDARAPLASNQRAEALYRTGDFEAAGAAFETTLAVARRLGRDSLARVATRAIPVCYYRQAEAAVAADSTRYERNAQAFERVATRWPDYALAPVAQYRAGLGYARAGRHRDALRAMQGVVERFPRSEFVREARLEIARSWEALGEQEPAAQAYLEFARGYPDDESAGPAYLRAADLEAAAGQGGKADTLRLTYIRKFPGDVETAMSILEGMARRELEALGDRPIASLLRAPQTAAAGSAARRAPQRNAADSPPPSRLADYLRRAAARPDLASRPLVAEVRFLQGEEGYAAYGAARLTQPLTRSIPIKKRLLDTLLVRYRRCVDLGVPDWAHAAAFRIGLALVEFGDALEHSERPADLHGDDLLAYEDVLADQSRGFDERGEGVWSDLLRQPRARNAPDDEWIAQAQSRLWQRLGNRFLYQPEAEFPLVRATPPPRDSDPPEHAERGKSSSRDSSRDARALSDRPGPGR